uniref:phage terminase large subunit family protein n=1 Tax=Synechococcus sp. UW106 TaxID=368495 RepID=UPI000E0E464E|nr:hypothetical protein [Synechococcus sp. UW106]
MFSLDRENPARKMRGENDLGYKLFTLWLTGTTGRELAELADVSPSQISKLKEACCWEVRKVLIEGQAKLAEVVTLEDEIKQEQKYDTRTPAVRGSNLSRPPAPIKRGLRNFALQYGPMVAPNFEIDSLMGLFLDELERWVEGEHNFLQISPHPRSGKSLAAGLAMAYSYLRYPTRDQILISASGRLSSMANQRLKTLIEAALPEDFELSKAENSKLAFRGDWQGAGLVYAASRGGQLMGLSGCRILCDDLVSSTAEVESTEIMSQAVRTMTTDLFTRLTNDNYGKGAGLCFIAQRISNTDLVAEMVARERRNEEQGLQVTPWRVVVSPFLVPTLEEKARIVDSYPASWQLVWPRFGQVGEPVCSRFTKAFGDTLRSNMSERDWAAMYELNTEVDSEYCAWRRHYLQEIEEADINISQTVIAVDLNMAGGDKRSDKSALAVGGVQDGNVIVLGLHYLQGGLEEQLAQIADYAHRYNAFVVYVEKAAAGHSVLNSLSGRIGERTYQVKPISHRGLNKGARLNEVLGPAANQKFFIRKGLELYEDLQQQLRLIAITKGKTHRTDDAGDCVLHLLYACWNFYVKSGYGQSNVTWGHSGGTPGTTQCVWGRGDASVVRRGLDGVERVQIPGFS